MEIEIKLTGDEISPDIGGTVDCLVIEDDIAHVVDYKHGTGIVVEARKNTQLMIYALLVLLLKKGKIKKFRLTIVQPRAFHPSGPIRTWDITAEDLIFWKDSVLVPAIKDAESDFPTRKVGDHCRWCRAKAICPEMELAIIETAKADFSQKTIDLPDPAEMTVTDIAKVLGFSDIISGWVKAVAVHAQQILETGREIPGYKLVEKRSNRKWKNEKTLPEDLHCIGDQLYDLKVKSPAQVEKVMKQMKIPGDYLQNLYHKPPAGVTIAPESDRRPAVTRSPEIDFLDFLN